MDIIKTLTEEFSLKPFQVENTVKLIDDEYHTVYCALPQGGYRLA